jgi:hypothetical protein
MSKDKPAPYDMSIHSNSSALAWTKFFRECNPECNLNDDVMLGWFANAMMAMHDRIYQTTQPEQTEQEPVEDRIARWYRLGYEQGKKASQREPIEDGELEVWYSQHTWAMDKQEYMWGFRDAEKAHGITGGGE